MVGGIEPTGIGQIGIGGADKTIRMKHPDQEQVVTADRLRGRVAKQPKVPVIVSRWVE